MYILQTLIESGHLHIFDFIEAKASKNTALKAAIQEVNKEDITMVKRTWLDDFSIKIICPTTNKISKTYDSLVSIANELHTDFHYMECGENHMLTEHLVVLEKR